MSSSFVEEFKRSSGDIERISVAWGYLKKSSPHRLLHSRADWKAWQILVAVAPALAAGYVLSEHYWSRRQALGARESMRTAALLERIDQDQNLHRVMNSVEARLRSLETRPSPTRPSPVLPSAVQDIIRRHYTSAPDSTEIATSSSRPSSPHTAPPATSSHPSLSLIDQATRFINDQLRTAVGKDRFASFTRETENWRRKFDSFRGWDRFALFSELKALGIEEKATVWRDEWTKLLREGLGIGG